MSSVLDNPRPQDEENAEATFKPVIHLTEQVEVKTLEENEDVMFRMRAKLFRFDSDSSEWKERGTGDVKLLKHRESKKIRLVMRRDKTLKVCANHIISVDMRLQPNIGSDRSWVWKVHADYADGDQPVAETLAIRFANSDNANAFKEAFESAKGNNVSLAAQSDKADQGSPTGDRQEENDDSSAEPKAAADADNVVKSGEAEERSMGEEAKEEKETE